LANFCLLQDARLNAEIVERRQTTASVNANQGGQALHAMVRLLSVYICITHHY